MDLLILSFAISAFGVGLITIFWLAMIYDLAFRKFDSFPKKLLWLLFILLTAIIGAVVYYFLHYKNDRQITWFLRMLAYSLIILIILFFVLLSVPVFSG